MATLVRSPEQLCVLMARQPGQRFGATYQPAIRATPREAPSISRATILRAAKVGGREIHVLSRPEFWATLLALYHPLVVDLQEQRLLSTGPGVHPLFGHPEANAVALRALSGTVAIADQLGCLSRHPRILFRQSDDPEKWQRVPWPFIGDLLLILRDDAGLYCVNWTIKADRGSFGRSRIASRKPMRPRETDPNALTRHEIEEMYYLAADIRTVRVAGDELNMDVINNLRVLFTWHNRSVQLEQRKRSAMLEALSSLIGTDEPGYRGIQRIATELGTDRHTVQATLNQAIWSRTLRVDLFEPFLMDQPLRPEQLDVCDVYAAMFAR